MLRNKSNIIRITESNLKKIIAESIAQCILTESQESKSIDAAKKLAMQRGLSYEEADKFVRHDIRHDLPFFSHNAKGGKFILGVTRMYLDDQIRDAQTQNNLNTTLKYVASDAHYNEYDRNLNGMSAQDLIQRFAKNVKMDMEKDRNEVNSMQFEGESQYDIVRIDSFEQSSQYGDYTSWCVTHDRGNYDSYTCKGVNQIYFCLKNGFESVLEEEGENCPLDEYGLSMISVIVDENGSLVHCTSRWNHENGGSDNVMDAKQISQVIGMNFYEVFKPNNRWKEMVENALQRVRNGEDLKEVFDFCSNFYNGIASVVLNRKYNWIKKDGSLVSPDQWFDNCYDFRDGLATVELNGKYNWIKKDGSLLRGDLNSLDQWFDSCGNFYNGFARVGLNGKYNWIKKDGSLLRGDFNSLNQWFDGCMGIPTDFAIIKLNGKWKCIKIGNNGLLFNGLWFDDCKFFYKDFAIIGLNGKWNYINKDGLLYPNQWFDEINYFRDGIASVVLNRKYNLIDIKGNLLSPNQWFDKCEVLFNGFAKVELNGKKYKIDKSGNLTRELTYPHL